MISGRTLFSLDLDYTESLIAMVLALFISGIVLLWYCAREARKNKPNWPRAINTAIFWPLSLLFKVDRKSEE